MNEIFVQHQNYINYKNIKRNKILSSIYKQNNQFDQIKQDICLKVLSKTTYNLKMCFNFNPVLGIGENFASELFSKYFETNYNNLIKLKLNQNFMYSLRIE